MRVLDDKRPPARTFRNRLFPAEASTPFEHAVHWSARDRYLSWREEGLACYEPPNMSWAWPEICRGDVRIVEFSDDVAPGKPWAGSIEDVAPVVPKRQRKQRPAPRDPDEKPAPLQ